MGTWVEIKGSSQLTYFDIDQNIVKNLPDVVNVYSGTKDMPPAGYTVDTARTLTNTYYSPFAYKTETINTNQAQQMD